MYYTTFTKISYDYWEKICTFLECTERAETEKENARRNRKTRTFCPGLGFYFAARPASRSLTPAMMRLRPKNAIMPLTAPNGFQSSTAPSTSGAMLETSR